MPKIYMTAAMTALCNTGAIAIVSLLVPFVTVHHNTYGQTVQPTSLSSYVDPNIGSAHSRWFFYTPAAYPFGMVKLGPSTNGHYGNKSGWEAVGYDARHTSIEGFVHAHEFQVGGIAVMPVAGDLKLIPGKLEDPDGGYRSRFTKEREVAAPGYYKVFLDDYGITAELTAAKRVGFHRYTFQAGEEAFLIFDIGNRQGESGAVLDAQVQIKDDQTIEGWVITQPEYVKRYQPGAVVPIYFVARMERKPDGYGMFMRDSVDAVGSIIRGVGAGCYVSFDAAKEAFALEVQVGISYTSVENARLNLASESDMSFDEARTAVQEVWERELGKVRVEGGLEEDRIKFYTGLYHALLGRGLASDVHGAYPRNDGSTGQLPLNPDGTPQFNFYNTDAVWGAFWNLTQLWTLAWPGYLNDFVRTHLQVYRDAGWLGDGLANSRYVSGVGTNFVGLVIAAAYNCGIRNYDTDLALEAALKNELTWQDRKQGAGKMDVRSFIERGYIPHTEKYIFTPEASVFSASHALEYAFSAYAVAQFARSLDQPAYYDRLMRLSGAWENIYDTTTGFIRPRLQDGTFVGDFDPFQPWRGFQEGNAWQYTFYVPHEPEKLVEKMGKEQFNTRLDSIFVQARQTRFGGGKEINAFSGVKTLYNHGNQPSLHIPWLFNITGEPRRTQFWTRTICNEFYGTDGIHGYGYGQDEDQGQLGAWFVMASIGLFDVKGLTAPIPSLQLGSPAFDRITIKLDPDYCSGQEIVIDVKNNASDHYYLRSVKVNGKIWNEIDIPFHTLMKGAHMEIVKGD